MWLELLLKGCVVGLCASAPLGPIGVICVQRTINKGHRSGLASGYGAAIADTLFATVAVLGLSYIIDFIRAHETPIKIIGGVIIAVLGLTILLRNPLRELRRARREKSSLVQDMLWVLLLTLTNPLAILLFLALFAALHVVVPSGHHILFLPPLAGVHLGACAWWLLLTFMVAHFKSRFRLKQIWWFNKIAGATILVLGLVAASSALW